MAGNNNSHILTLKALGEGEGEGGGGGGVFHPSLEDFGSRLLK